MDSKKGKSRFFLFTNNGLQPLPKPIENTLLPKLAHIESIEPNQFSEFAGIISPLFVDCHTHDDLIITQSTHYFTKARQGVGTIIVGNCGISLFPLRKEDIPFKNYFSPVLGPLPNEFEAHTPEDYLKKIRAKTRVVLQLGYNTLKSYFLAGRTRLTNEDLRTMREYVSAHKNYIAAVSFGLSYYPANSSTADEICYVARDAPHLNFHIRSETFGFVSAIEEALRIGQRLNKPVHISHLKFIGSNAQYYDKVLTLLEKHNATFDLYPFNFGSTTIKALGPNGSSFQAFSHKMRETNWDNIFQFVGPDNIVLTEYDKSIALLAQEKNITPLKLLYELINSPKGFTIRSYGQNWQLMKKLLFHPRATIGSDGLPTRHPHPRLYSTFPTFLKLAHQNGIPTEDTLKKLIFTPATQFGFSVPTISLSEEALPNSDFVLLTPDLKIRAIYYNRKFLKPI